MTGRCIYGKNKMDKEKIKQKIKELEALLEEPERKENNDFKLKLNTGTYYYYGDGVIFSNGSTPRLTRCFNSFGTREQIKIASKRMSAQNELLQMAFILNGDWKPDWKNNSERKFAINFEYDSYNFYINVHFVKVASHVFFMNSPLEYFLATASDNLKAYIKGELQ